jgi:putative membrane protein
MVTMEIQRPDRGPHQEGELTPAHVDVRQQLAADQTLLAWIRTAIALSALGFVVARFNLFLHQVQRVSATSGEAARIIGLVLVAAAALLLVLGLLEYRQVTALLADHGDPLDATRWPAVVAAAVCLLAVVAIGIYLATGVN